MIVQAASGAMAKTGFADGPPLRSGITIADHTTATFAALGIVAALRQRDLTGTGQLVDVAMLDVLTALVWDEPVDHYAAIGMPVRTGNADGRGAPINTYRCADGWVSVTCTSDGQFERLCALDGATGTANALSGRPRPRAAARAEIDAAIEAWTVDPTGACCRAGAHRYRFPGRTGARSRRGRDRPGRTRAASSSSELRHPDAPIDRPSGFLGARLPIVFDGRVDLPPAERFGASTDAVLRELAGCDDAELERLRDTGVIA